MPEVSRVARFIFHVTLGKSRIFLSYLMLCLHRVVRPPFGVTLWQRRGNYPPFIVIAMLGKAEAIQYKLLNHYINAFIRKNYQTGLLRSARNDAGWG